MSEPTTGNPASPTVLIVDDDEDCRFIYRAALEHEGMTVITANNGLEGVRLARAHEPDVILMDLAMPIMDGTTAAQMLKANRATGDLPIVAVTAYVSLATRNASATPAFEEVIPKPAQPADLVAAVRRTMKSQG